MKTAVTSLVAALIGFMIAHALQSESPALKPERIVVREPAPVVDTVSAVRATIRAELHPAEPPAPPERTAANDSARRDGDRIVEAALAAHRWTEDDRRALRGKLAELASPDDLAEIMRPIIIAENAGELAVDGPLL